MKITCENEFCIYQWEHRCKLECISLDITGMCEQCVHILVSKSELKAYKDKLLKMYRDPE